MDDFSTSGLHESKNEWGARLLTILTPHITDGFRSILDESVRLCMENDEMEKYLMTFQNLISRIPKWNSDIIENETKRIIEKSGCSYLEDLVTCVHVIQLKILTAVRVGQKPKKVDIDIMNIHDFIHKVYVNCARQVYKNVYLFELECTPLEKQKHNRELEIIAQECILNTVRESIPVQTILRCYLDETTEEDIKEEVKEENITPIDNDEPTDDKQGGDKSIKLDSAIEDSDNKVPELLPDADTSVLDVIKSNTPSETEPIVPALSFSNIDKAVDTNKNEFDISAPKDIDTLEKISEKAYEQRKREQEDDDDEDDDKISISTESIKLDSLDIHSISDTPKIDINAEPLINEIEILDA
tara:strand:- start:3381 stop:4451 length:1071 start_codon:yes stop_codon:yes gene_type:complete